MYKKLLLAILLVILCACSNSGSGASATKSDSDELYSQALLISPSVQMTASNFIQVECQFNGQTLSNGQSITAFQNSSVVDADSCISEIRTCTNGVLSGSYNYSSCQASAAAVCLFNGENIADGQAVLAYRTQNVELGAECESEYRTCSNGQLSGSFQHASCNLSLPASCLFNGQTVASGSRILAYQNSNVAFSESCQMEYRSCENGQLTGSFHYASCTVNEASGCLFNGQTMAHGQTVSAYLNTTGASCNMETRTCNNGQLSGSYNYASCQIDQYASCLFDGKTVVHGDSVTAFEKSSVNYAEMCRAETRTCDNGHLSGSFNYSSCDAGQPMSCLFNGQTIAHGQTVTAYLNSTGASCDVESRTCNDGQLTGSYNYASCQILNSKSCLLKGLTITHGQTLTVFKKSSVSEHEQCEAEQRKCHDGRLSGSYTQLSCTIKNCPEQKTKGQHHPDRYENDKHDYVDGFKDDDRQIKICQYVTHIKKAEKSCERFNDIWGHSHKKYKESYDCGLHLGWYKHKHHHHSCGKKKGWYNKKIK